MARWFALVFVVAVCLCTATTGDRLESASREVDDEIGPVRRKLESDPKLQEAAVFRLLRSHLIEDVEEFFKRAGEKIFRKRPLESRWSQWLRWSRFVNRSVKTMKEYFKNVAKKVKHGVKNAGKKIKHGVKNVGKKIKHGVENVGKNRQLKAVEKVAVEEEDPLPLFLSHGQNAA